jgi:hypothetical protein
MDVLAPECAVRRSIAISAGSRTRFFHRPLHNCHGLPKSLAIGRTLVCLGWAHGSSSWARPSSKAAVVQNGLIRIENAVGDPVVADKLPDVLHRIEFGALGWQRNECDVLWHAKLGGQMPAGLIEQKRGMPPWSRRRFSQPRCASPPRRPQPEPTGGAPAAPLLPCGLSRAIALHRNQIGAELAWRISSFAISNQICRLPGIPSRVIISENWYKQSVSTRQAIPRKLFRDMGLLFSAMPTNRSLVELDANFPRTRRDNIFMQY